MRSALLQGAAFGTLTGTLAALVDVSATLLAGFHGPPLWFAAYCWALLVLFSGWLGAAFAGWLELLRALFARGTISEPSAGRRVLFVLRCLAAALPLLAFVWWVPASWVEEHWAELTSRGRALVGLSYLLLLLGTLVVSLCTAWLARHLASPSSARLARLLAPALLLLAAACYAADRVILVGLYDDFHYGLFGGFLLSLAASLVLGAVAFPARARAWARGGERGTWPLLAFAVAVCVTWARDFAGADLFGPSQSLAFGKLVTTGRALSDFDGDGVSGLFGGSDCAGFDERSAPGRFDFPGNGTDEDCSGSDARWPEPRAQVDYPIPDRSGHDVVLITVDTLRADHLGAYGYSRATSPNVDALARRSLVFDWAFSPAPKTFDSLPALFAGLYPSNIARDYSRKNRDPKWRKSRFDERAYVYEVGPDSVLLAERFQQRGYHTVGCSYVPLLPLLGLARGFDRFVQARSCRKALAQTKKRAEPLFFWVHLYAPHEPYVRHPEFDFGGQAIDRYDSEIAKDDAEIGALLGLLEQRGRMDRTIIAVSADHGEEFREHGGESHTMNVYRELIHVPLVLHIPGVEPGRIAQPVEIMGLNPTLCELARLEGPCDDFDAPSLLRTLHAPEQAEGAVSEVHRRGSGILRRSLYTERWHLVLDLQRDRVELYDVSADRNEQLNVAAEHPDVVASLHEQLLGRIRYRAARVFEAYASQQDPLQLARGLPVLQDEQLLEQALGELEKQPSPALVEHLERLAARPGLGAALLARARALRERSAATRSASNDSAGNDSAANGPAQSSR